MNTQRKIIFHEHYFIDFYLKQNEKVQEKIEYVFKIIRTSGKSFLTIWQEQRDYMRYE